MSKIYGYARVSSRTQIDGNSLENQEKLLKEHGAEQIYLEQFTGTKTDRPVFKNLIGKLEKGDTLIVTKLDRFARSTIEGSKLVEELINRGIKVNILNIGIMDNTPGSKLIRNIFFAFAEFERDMIIERTQEGKEIAKLKEGYKEGRPKKFTRKQLDHAVSMAETHTYKEIAAITGISKSTLIRYMKNNRN